MKEKPTLKWAGWPCEVGY